MPDPMDIMTMQRSVAGSPVEVMKDGAVVVVNPSPSTPIEVTPAPVAPVTSTAEPPKEFTAVEEYQATDLSGKPIGPPSKVVGKGVTEAEAYRDLAHKMRDININAARKIKEYRDKYRSYDQEKDNLTFLEPQPLTAEDRVRIARLLADPATIDEGYREMYRVQFGETVDEARQRKVREAEAASISRGKAETDKFLVEHPDFPGGNEAKKVVLAEMQKRKEAAVAEGKTFGWTAHNLEIIYDDLVERGELVPLQLTTKEPEPVTPSPITMSERASQENTPPIAAPANPVPVDANTPAEQGNLRPRGTRHATLSTDHGQPPNVSSQNEDDEFRKEVNSLPIDVLRRRILHDKKFADRLNKLRR